MNQEEIKVLFAKNLRYLCQEDGWDCAKFAERLSVQALEVDAWREGQALPSMRQVSCIASVLGSTPDDLLMKDIQEEMKLEEETKQPRCKEIKAAFAKNLAYLKAKKGVSTQQLGDCLGCSYQAVYGWENEKTLPAVDKLLRLAFWSGFSIEDLTTLSIEKKELARATQESEVREKTEKTLQFNQ